MVVNWHWPGWTWLEHTGENAAITFCGAFMGMAAASGARSLSTVPWLHALDVAGYAALLPMLAAVTSLRVGNGTASFLPNVVATPAGLATPPDATTGSE